MIHVAFRMNQDGELVGFYADCHGDPIVCAAVSALIINTTNSIENLTDADFVYEYPDKKFIDFRLTREADAGTSLLLRSLKLGLCTIADEYPDDLIVEEVFVLDK